MRLLPTPTVGILLLLTGCATYAPMPVDLAAHRDAWLARDPGGATVRDYLRQLSEMNAQTEQPLNLKDGLSLEEAQVVALVFNPHLRVARLKAKVPVLGSKEAGRWDDPELDFELLRFIENFDKPWLLGASLAFTIPISGRVAVEKDKAIAEADVELRRAHEAEWAALAELRRLWLAWSASRQKVALTKQYIEQVDEAVRVAGQQRKFGKIGTTGERVLLIEQASRRGDLATNEATAREQELAIKAALGLAPKADVHLIPTLSADAAAHEGTAKDAAALLAHPRLKLAAAEYEAAEQALRLAIRKQYPDLKIGPAGEWEEGDWKAGLTLSVPIPILNANRREIAETSAARDAAMASLETEYESLMSEAVATREKLQAARRRRQHLESQVAPLVDQQIVDLRKQAGLGELDVLITLDTLERSLQTKLDALEAQHDEAAAAGELRSLLDAPLLTPTLKNLSKQETGR